MSEITTQERRRTRIAIIGSGIGGMSLALGIQGDTAVQELCEIAIFEKSETPRDDEGWGIILGYDGYLASYIDTEEVMACLNSPPDPDGETPPSDSQTSAQPEQQTSTAPTAADVPRGTLQVCLDEAGGTAIDHAMTLSLATQPMAPPAPLNASSPIAKMVKRGKFSARLREHLDANALAPDSHLARIAAGKRLVRIELGKVGPTNGSTDQQGEPKHILHFQDGSSYEADIVLGCDGVNSMIRGSVTEGFGYDARDPKFAAKLTECVMLRRSIPRATAEKIFGKEYCIPLSQRGHVGKDVFVFTDWNDNGQSAQVVADWPYKGWDGKTEGPPVLWDRQLARQELSSMGPVGSSFADVFDPPGEEDFKLYALTRKVHPEPLPSFVHPHAGICLVGDAAHTFQPCAGAGASAALRDALVVSTLFRHACREHLKHQGQGPQPSVTLPAALRACLNAYNTVRGPGRVATGASSDSACFFFTGHGENGLDPAKWKEYNKSFAEWSMADDGTGTRKGFAKLLWESKMAFDDEMRCE